ncbi:hypothetical protein [Bacillus mycoides]|uniref:hypothetical protein n=1 Tax=Bacillus mycoides TaxID=1405 RepID=UPI0036EEB62C
MESLLGIINALERRVGVLEQKINLKVDKGDVLITSEQEERLKKVQERVERSNGISDPTCEHEWIKVPLDDGIFVGCPKCRSVDVEETKRLSRELASEKGDQ